MKKILILLICLMMVIGCKNNNNSSSNTNSNNNEPKEPEIVYYTKEEAQIRLREIAEDIYQNKKYESYTKENGKYYISLKELRDTLKYDTNKVDYIDGLKCDENETGVSIDIDNLEKVDYVGDPIITLMLCNPPTTETNDNIS